MKFRVPEGTGTDNVITVVANGRVQFTPAADPIISLDYRRPEVADITPAIVSTLGGPVVLTGQNFGWNSTLVLVQFTNLKVSTAQNAFGSGG